MNCDNNSTKDHRPDMGYGPDKPQIKAEPEDIKENSPYEFAALFFSIGLFPRFILA